MHFRHDHSGLAVVGPPPQVSFEAPRAFPGAEGLAANTRGAAGYSGAKNSVIVSNLNDSGAGSYRAAIGGAGKEGTFVTFATSGIIDLDSIVDITSDYVTIMGQTSPGGICFAGNMPQVGGSGVGNHDIIIRHIRSIAGSHGGAADSDEEAFRIWSASDVMVDHCSFAWGGDETASVTAADGTECARITFSKCIISQGLTDPAPEDDHGYGLFFNFGAGTGNSADVYKCYLPHHQKRMPKMQGDGFWALVNNVLYDYDKMFTITPNLGDNAELNIIGCYVKPGTNSEGPYTGPGRAAEAMQDPDMNGTPYEAIYMLNNFGVVRVNDADSEWAIVDYNTDALMNTAWQSLSQFASPAGGLPLTKVVLLAATAEAQAEAILADCGATKPSRDSHDTSMVDDFSDDTGDFLADANYDTNPELWPTYSTPSPPTDSNSDGIPDDWTAANMGGDAWDDLAPSGYLWIEEYGNSLA